MNSANTVRINGFELRASNNTALEHRTHCPSTSSELPVRVSAAGGSAIYRNLQSSTNCSEIIVNANKSCGNSVLRKHNVGDICLVDVKVEDLTLFIPSPDLETPIVLWGDFNCDPQQNSYLVEFMRNEFGLNYVPTSPTTLGNTTIDCTFTRNINVEIMPEFVSVRLSEENLVQASIRCLTSWTGLDTGARTLVSRRQIEAFQIGFKVSKPSLKLGSFTMREKGGNRLVPGPDYMVDALKLLNQAARVSGESLQACVACHCLDGIHLFCWPILGVSSQSLASNGSVVDSRYLNLVFGPTEATHNKLLLSSSIKYTVEPS
ncbi:uncharacterized protein TNCV_3320491 [Trichonephila clavipes]|nr:uncharacterized protein TNCV_3320491 [Trichonephila clavipes]